MTGDEKAFLAQIALGWFVVKPNGTIWRLAEFVGGGTPRLRFITPRRAERSKSARNGYLRVMFRDSDGRKKVAAHRIVWMVVNQKDIPNGMEVNHDDGNKQNNHPKNLEPVTHQGNMIHAFKNLPMKKKEQRGMLNASAILTDAQILEIRALWKSRSMTQREIAELFNTKQTNISNIVTRKTWAHLP